MPQSRPLRTSRVIQSRAEEERGFVRKIIALTAAAGLLVTLAACSTSAPSGACEPVKSPGDASSVVTATGAFGKDPAAKFPTPLITDGIQVSTIDAGEGETVYDGQYANFQATAYDGATGEPLLAPSYDASAPLTNRVGESSSKIGEALECATVGSRIAVTMTAGDLYGFYSVTEATNGLADKSTTIVLVIDVEGAILGKAYGVDQLPQQGLPSVVTAPDGQPGVTVPNENAPSSLKIAVLKQGDGAVVEEGQTIYAHYLRVSWDDPKSASSSKSTWTDFGSPELLSLTPFDAATGVGLTPGALQAIVGQKVGSQVLAVVPPAFGWPDGSAPDGVDGTTTLVYVIDILGVVK